MEAIVMNLLLYDFNPLPRKEGDKAFTLYRSLTKISIHSLVKRETALTDEFSSPTGNFNPLPRKEGDTLVPKVLAISGGISIHSLVKRETPGRFNAVQYCPFQSTPS